MQSGAQPNFGKVQTSGTSNLQKEKSRTERENSDVKHVLTDSVYI